MSDGRRINDNYRGDDDDDDVRSRPLILLLLLLLLFLRTSPWPSGVFGQAKWVFEKKNPLTAVYFYICSPVALRSLFRNDGRPRVTLFFVIGAFFSRNLKRKREISLTLPRAAVCRRQNPMEIWNRPV